MRNKIIIIIIALICLGAGGYGGLMYPKVQALEQESIDLKQQLADAEAKVSALETEKSSGQQKFEELLTKEMELDAAKSALANGVALKDFEAMVGTSKNASVEHLLAIGALRMLTKGRNDPETLAAFQTALEKVEWAARLKSMCAAQSGIAATGNPIRILADCAREARGEAPSEPQADTAASPTKPQ